MVAEEVSLSILYRYHFLERRIAYCVLSSAYCVLSIAYCVLRIEY
jgi:hypothetical protein